MALAGLSVVGRDKYGVFPLRGKLLNVKDAPLAKIMQNEEISALKKIMGLESGKVYQSIEDLRYGKIMVMTDQDVDGSHIKGLIFNVFHTMWPSLFRTPDFIQSMLTPIVKARKGNTIVSFFNLTKYNEWKDMTPDASTYKTKYYKGLGTSTSEEAKEYFSDLNVVVYKYSGEKCESGMDLAFNKKLSDKRKEWMETYDYSNTIGDTRDVSYGDFVDKELAHFSHYDIERSIPSVIDGLKPSQRKIMFGVFKRGAGEVKVEQLAGYVSEHSAYHHGESSLHGAIVGLAQNYVGSNNLELLAPIGQFGSRIQGGKDAASPRYIYCDINPVAQKLFKKADMQVLKYLEDDGQSVEPEWYCPILPLALINGANGIGTGFSTQLPNYNPLDVLSNVRACMRGEEMSEMTPWYRGFCGTVFPMDTGKAYGSRGLYTIIDDTKVEITELPIGVWTEDYKHFLEEYMDNNPKVLKDYTSQYTDVKVKFVLHFFPGQIPGDFDKVMKMVGRNMSVNNVHLVDRCGRVKKYVAVNDIVADFCEVRREMYEKRKAHQVDVLIRALAMAKSRVLFIHGVKTGDMDIFGLSKSQLEGELSKDDRFYFDRGSVGSEGAGCYDYLTKMPMYNLTSDKLDQLRKETDSIQLELDELLARTIDDLWNEELDDFEKAYTSSLVDFMATMDNDTKPPATKKMRKK